MPRQSVTPLDVVTLGRVSVDLYGQQIGGRLEDMASFAKSVGGCPANIAIGCARLGLKAALLSAVGDEAMGRFVREQLIREGVETRGLKCDPERLTALVLLGVRGERSFPLIFYRENCADMALRPADLPTELLRNARALVLTGTHLSQEDVRRTSFHALALARAAGAKIVLDIDYRPNLWGLAGHDGGEARYVASAEVSSVLQEILPQVDVIVGTEEEFAVAGGQRDPESALAEVRARSAATLVVKRGADGCSFQEAGKALVTVPGFPVEVYNVLGAGDAFLAGLLAGWLGGKDWTQAARMGNACGALAVSRLLCSPEYPSRSELAHFLERGSRVPAVRKDEALTQLHWATTGRRQGAAKRLLALAIDHRAQFEELAERLGAGRERIVRFKSLAVQALREVAGEAEGFGLLLDDTYGAAALAELADSRIWVARPVERPGARPLVFEPGPAIAAHLLEWPITHTVKCLVFYHPRDPETLKVQQEEKLLTLQEACRRLGRTLLIEVVAGKHGPLEEDTVAEVLRHFYQLGLKPDWWKLEPQERPGAWRAIEEAIATGDPSCLGVLLLGLEATEAALARAFAGAAASSRVKGFAIGRSVFLPAAEAWLAGRWGDEQAKKDMAERFARLVRLWDEARARAVAA